MSRIFRQVTWAADNHYGTHVVPQVIQKQLVPQVQGNKHEAFNANLKLNLKTETDMKKNSKLKFLPYLAFSLSAAA